MQNLHTIYIKCVLRIPYENILMISDFPHIRLCCLSYIITKLLRSFYVKLCNMNIDARRKKIYAQWNIYVISRKCLFALIRWYMDWFKLSLSCNLWVLILLCLYIYIYLLHSSFLNNVMNFHFSLFFTALDLIHTPSSHIAK